MNDKPFMPKATAVWLVENTKISFKKGIKAYNPILAGQLTREEIESCSQDVNRQLALNNKNLEINLKSEKKTNRYIPLSKRQDRPEAALWLTRNFTQLSDGQIVKLVGSTKKTVSAIRNKNYWNSSNLSPKDPVVSNLCTQIDIQNAVDKADKKKKEIEKQKKKLKSEI